MNRPSFFHYKNGDHIFIMATWKSLAWRYILKVSPNAVKDWPYYPHHEDEVIKNWFYVED